MRQQHANAQSRIAANVYLSRNASRCVRHLTASKDGDKKCETYLMFRIAKGSAKPDKAHESFGIAQPDGRRNHLSISYKDSNTHTRRHSHTDTYTLLSRKRAHRFLLCCTPKSVCCFLFVRYFKFNYPVMKWAATDTAAAPNSSPHWLTKVCAAWSKDSPMLNNSNHSGNIPNTLSLPVSLAAKPKYP